jgi:hypothetical protein
VRIDGFDEKSRSPVSTLRNMSAGEVLWTRLSTPQALAMPLAGICRWISPGDHATAAARLDLRPVTLQDRPLHGRTGPTMQAAAR